MFSIIRMGDLGLVGVLRCLFCCRNWLGTSRLPLTRTAEELPCLCAYLVIREAMRDLFHRRETSESESQHLQAVFASKEKEKKRENLS